MWLSPFGEINTNQLTQSDDSETDAISGRSALLADDVRPEIASGSRQEDFMHVNSDRSRTRRSLDVQATPTLEV